MKLIVIKHCSQCPNYVHGNSYSLDGFDRGSDRLCKLAGNKVIASFVEWHEQEPKTIPEWCPLP